MTGGFIVIHRKLFDWEWYGQPEMTALWLHLLLSANWEDKTWRGHLIERGSFVTTLSSLSRETGLSIQQVRTGLKKLQSSTQINIQTTHEATKITICNYESYQSEQILDNTPNNTQPTREATHTEQNNNITSKEEKSGTNVPQEKKDAVDRLYNLYPTKCPISNRRTEKGKDSKQILARLLKSRSEDNIEKLINKYLSDCIASKTYIANFATMLRKIESGKLDDLELPYEQKPETANRPKIHYYNPSDDPNYKAQ